MKKLFSYITIVLSAVALLAGAANCTARQQVTLNISAAASLTDVVKEVNSLYVKDNSWITLTSNFGSSGTLQKQIENGAPTDVFITASTANMEALQKQGLLAGGTMKNLLMNKLVLIVPADSKLNLADFKDLTGDMVGKIAIGDPKSVPAGTYARQVFDNIALTEKLASKLVMSSDVRQVLTYVESGNVDAGIVYLTDARTSTKVKIAANAPDDINAKIVYPVAVIKASKYLNEAAAYETFLFNSGAKTVFEKYGFTVIK